MLRKFVSLLLLQLVVFSSFGWSLHACFCCGDDKVINELSSECHLEETASSTLCSFCLQSERSADSQKAPINQSESEKSNCLCSEVSNDSGCTESILTVSTDAEDSKVSQNTGISNTFLYYDAQLPILLSYFIFPELINPELAKIDKLKTSLISSATKESIFIHNCIFRI